MVYGVAFVFKWMTSSCFFRSVLAMKRQLPDDPVKFRIIRHNPAHSAKNYTSRRENLDAFLELFADPKSVHYEIDLRNALKPVTACGGRSSSSSNLYE